MSADDSDNDGLEDTRYRLADGLATPYGHVDSEQRVTIDVAAKDGLLQIFGQLQRPWTNRPSREWLSPPAGGRPTTITIGPSAP